MGGKTWSRDEERHFWETIVPQSPQAADPANRSLTWKGCAAEMQQLMGDSRRRIYTPTMLYEHYYQNMMSNHTSPRAGEFFPKHKADIARFAEKEEEKRRMQEQDEEEEEGGGEEEEGGGEEVAGDDNDGEAGEEEREMQRLRRAEVAGQEELLQAAAASTRKRHVFTKSYLLTHFRQPPTAATETRKRGRSPSEDEPAAKRQRDPPVDYRLRSAHLCSPEAARASNEPGCDARAIPNAGHLPPSNTHPTHAPGSSAFFDLVCNPVDTAAEPSDKGRTPLPSERRARDGFPPAQGSSGSSDITSHSAWNDESRRREGYSSHNSNTSSVPQDPENTDAQKAMSYCP